MENEIIMDFNNDNFPLQFDLIILSKNRKYEKENYFFHQLSSTKTPLFMIGIEDIINDKKINDINIYIDDIKNKMVNAFRTVLKNEKINGNIEKNKKIKKNKNKDREKKRDDRYCIIIDRMSNKLYLYPPFIHNGDKNAMIKHRKKIISNNDDDDDDEDDDDDIDKKEEEEEEEDDNDNNNNDEEEDEMTENKFSLIGYECNELTNFYLTSLCLIPSTIIIGDKNDMILYGVNEFKFVFSAHFHVQKDWYKHPKLKLYQYFNGGGLRFFKNDMINIWKKYFNKNNGLKEKEINELKLYDKHLDLTKCDQIYKKWYGAIKRSIINNNKINDKNQ